MWETKGKLGREVLIFSLYICRGTLLVKQMELHYYGHSCFLVELDGKKILFDPFISGNDLAKEKVDIEAIEADYILISHGHSDHILDAVSMALRTGAKVIANWEVCAWLEKQGVTNVHPVNHGGKLNLDFGIVKFTNAIHSSSMPDGSYGGNPLGFVVQTKEKNFYYAGDTALTYDMKLIGHFCKIDYCLLPIGDNFTMGIDDAIIASDFVQCNQIIGLHYDTFGYIVIDHEMVQKKCKKKHKTLTLIEIGKSIEL